MSEPQHIEIQTSSGNVIGTTNLISTNNANVNNIISSVANNTSNLNTNSIQNSASSSSNNGKPRGKMTAYAFFVHTCRQELKNSRPNQNVVFGEFSKKCAAKWKELEPHNKKPFEEMAARDKQRWEQEVEVMNRQKQQQQAQLPPQQQIIQTTGPNGETIQQIVTVQPSDPQYQHSANQDSSGQGPSNQHTQHQENTNQRQTNRGKKKKNPQPKDPNAPKRPHSAFLLYCSDHRPVVKEQCPGARIGDIAKKLAAGWAKLDPQVKSHYEEASNQQKQRYKEEKEVYVKKKQQTALEEQQRRQEQHRLQQEQQRQQQEQQRQQQQQFQQQHQQMNLNSLQQQQLSPVITRFDNNQNTYMTNGGQTIIQTNNQHELGGQPQTLAIIQNHNPGNGGSPRTYVQEVIQGHGGNGGQQIISNQPQYTRRAIIQDENGQQQVYIIQTPSNNHNQIQLSSNNGGGHRIIGGTIMSTNQHGQQIQIQGLGNNNNNGGNNNNHNNMNNGGNSPIHGGISLSQGGNQIRVNQPPVKTIQRINHPHGNANSGGNAKPKKVKQIKDPNAPKRPHSAFLLYCAEHRPKLRQEFPGARIGDMAKKLGQNWANVDAKTKQYFEELSNQQKRRYAKEKEEYKASLASGDTSNLSYNNNNNNSNNNNVQGSFSNNNQQIQIVGLKNTGRQQIQLQNANMQELSEEHLIQGQDEEGNVHYLDQGEILSHDGLPTMTGDK